MSAKMAQTDDDSQTETEVEVATTVESGDASIHVVAVSAAGVYGKTVDAGGSEYVWRFAAGDLEWLVTPGYYIRVKTETVLMGV